ncbi:hypothetical protein PHYSODRAFT_424820, partial [Phytophthora sojae]
SSVEFELIQLMPFPIADIFSAFWSIAEMEGSPDGENAVAMQLSRDVYAVNAHMRVSLESGNVIDIHSSSVLKRFVTSDGVVILKDSNWKADHPDTSAWCLTTQEGGSFGMRDYGDSSGVCQLRSVLRLQPVAFRAQAVNEVVIPSFRELAISRDQFVENALFD